MEIRVEKSATPSDAAELWPVYDAVFGDHADETSWRETMWERHAARDGFRWARACRDGRLVGFAYGYTGAAGQWWTDTVAEALAPDVAARWLGGHFELVSIGVLPDHRGRGLGRRLLRALTQDLLHDRLLLMTTADPDDPARRLYADQGWDVLGPGTSPGTVTMGRRRGQWEDRTGARFVSVGASSVFAVTTRTHPVAGAVAQASSVLSGVREQSLLALTSSEVAGALSGVAGLRSQLAELETRLVEHAATVEVEQESGAKSTADWLAHHTRVTKGAAHGVVRLLTGLNAYPPLRDSLAEGAVLPEQARVILRAADELPEEHRDAAVTELIGYAAEFDASRLRILGRKILEVIAPDLADAHEAALLEKLEEEADTQTRMYLRQTPDGTVEGRFTIPALAGAKLQKALWELAAPGHVRAVKGKGSYDYTVPTPKKLGQAFVEFLDKKVDTTLVVTADHDTVFGALGKAGWVETGQGVSPTALRHLACSAGIMPAVLDGQGHVLDLGRKKRLHTKAQRIALTVERRTCSNPTCDVPAYRCHVHHVIEWNEGGHTNIRDADLTCPRHHRLLHRQKRSTPRITAVKPALVLRT